MRLLKYRDLGLELPRVEAKMAGHFKMVATKLDGRSRVLAEFENLVTDVGLNRMGFGEFRNMCAVGTGSAAPVPADVVLQTTRARTFNGAPNVPGSTAQNSPPYYATAYSGFRFNVGQASGNLTEVGVGWQIGGGLNDYQLWSRALILDGNNQPTAVTVLSDEVLDVYYSIRMYPPTTDATYNVTIGNQTYACISRASQVTSVSSWQVPGGRVLFQNLNFSWVPPAVFSGTIGTITGSPDGSSAYNAGISNANYSNNSLQQDATLSWGLDAGNVFGGIRSVQYQTGVGMYQTQFTPAIPKDNTKVLSIGFRVGWGRRT